MLNNSSNNTTNTGVGVCNSIVDEWGVQFFGEGAKIKVEVGTFEWAAQQIIEKSEQQGFQGFVLSWHGDTFGKTGANKFGAKYATWYATNYAETRFWIECVLPSLRRKINTNSLGYALTNEQIDDIYTPKEQRTIITEQRKRGYDARLV